MKPAHLATPRSEPKVLSDRTYLVIRDLILEHEILPNSWVNIDAISVRLGVSPTPVREALARLESDGLVVKNPMRGYSTTPILTKREYDELLQFRILIEGWTASAAAKQIATRSNTKLADQLRAEMRVAWTALADQESGIDVFRKLTEHDSRLHQMIAAAAGNQLVARSFERTHFHLHFLRVYLSSRNLTLPIQAPRTTTGGIANSAAEVLATYDSSSPVSLTLKTHEGIVESIIAGNSSLASSLMCAHINLAAERFKPIYELLEPSEQN